MDPDEAAVTAGRSAYERGDWAAAHRQFRQARETAPLAPADLVRLSRAAFACGEIGDTIRISEELYRRLLRDGDVRSAAMSALDLGLLWVTHGDVVVASGWINRARRILGTEPEATEHGFLLYLDSRFALMKQDREPAAMASAELMRMGEHFNSPSLTCLGLVLSGMVDVIDGRSEHGFAQLDEAMLPLLAGEVDPLWAGDIYCTVIDMCHRLSDLARMRAWTDVTQRWCSQFEDAMIYTGVCRVHQLQLNSAESGWSELEAALVRSCSELEGRHAWAAGEAWYQLGDIIRLRGRLDEARTAFSRARELGIDPQPGEAMLHVAEGQPDVGWTALSAALQLADSLTRVRLLRPAVELASGLGLSEEAERLCLELEEAASMYASAGFRAWSQHARALILVGDRRPDDALPMLRLAARHYHDHQSRYELAQAYELMGRAHHLLGHTELGGADFSAAVAIYRDLGAVPDVHRLTEAWPGGLTQREVEVLTQVAAGASNKEIARTLFISDKTVSRHLANIFNKLDVTSRTAAAAWAHKQQLTSGPGAP